MEDFNESDSSEQTSDTSVTEESTSQVEATEAEQQASAPVEKQEEKPIPFHEHPRWKEVIEERNSFKQSVEESRRVIERLQAQMEMLKPQQTKSEPAKDKFLEDLEKISPEYAKSFQSVMDQARKAEQVEQRLAQYEQRETANAAINKFQGLLTANKVEDAMDKELYEKAVRAEVYEQEARGKKLNLDDLEKIFNSFHGKYSKAMEERNRKLTASYVQAKTKDTSPKGTTGGAPAVSSTKKIAAGDLAGQTKWLAEQIRSMKKTI